MVIKNGMGLGSWVLGSVRGKESLRPASWVLGPGSWVLGPEPRVPGPESKSSELGCGLFRGFRRGPMFDRIEEIDLAECLKAHFDHRSSA